ncbi:MAG: hypothetical protein ACI8Z7_000017 [Candidatus Nanohaloarchaea archaeon]|jgi:hypothetical protein
MADIANAAILASIVVGMVSIPAASGSISAQDTVPEPVDNISSTQDMPKEESTELTSDAFTRAVETAFSEFRTKVSSGSVEGELETPQSSLKLDRSSGSVEWKMETPRGTLTVEQKPSKVTEKTVTPHGTLEKTRQNGAVKTSFEGTDREKVEKTASELRDLMEKKKQKYQSKSDKMRTRQYSQGVSLDVAPETPEKAVLENQMERSLDLEDWKISNNNPDYFELNQTLKQSQKLHVYSAERSEINVTENESDRYVYGSDLTWEDGSDTAKLFDSGGNEIESYSYTS